MVATWTRDSYGGADGMRSGTGREEGERERGVKLWSERHHVQSHSSGISVKAATYVSHPGLSLLGRSLSEKRDAPS